MIIVLSLYVNSAPIPLYSVFEDVFYIKSDVRGTAFCFYFSSSYSRDIIRSICYLATLLFFDLREVTVSD